MDGTSPDVRKDPMGRRLAAVGFLDVAGYSRLMGVDADGTLRQWIALRDGLIEPCLAARGGRVVDRAGDGLLVEFASAGDAVAWALEVQEALAPGTGRSPLSVRIALHLDDVIIGTEGALHGEGVNVAARLQAYAEPGGVVMSKAVVDAAGGRFPLRVLDLGELQLHNILHPVHAFALRTGPRPVPALPAAEARPSLAVLPFRRNASDPEQSYVADGIVEGIIHVLAGLERLLVIARGSTLGYAGTTAPLAAGRDLAVRYVLHGSVQRSGGRFRISTALDDATTGAVVRSDRYEGQAEDLFELQDRISEQVATTLAPQLRERELARALRKHPGSMTAYDLMLQATDGIHRQDRESFMRARGLLQRAMADDPGYGPPCSHAALWHILRITQGWSPDPAEDSAEAIRLARAAIEHDRNDALAMAVQGYVTAYGTREHEAALLLLERAVDAGSSCPLAWAFNGIVRAWLGDGPGAMTHTQHGLRLSPFDPFVFLHEHFLSHAHYVNGTYDEAIAWGRRSAASNPRHAPTHRALAVSLVAAGRLEEACESAQRVLEIEPTFRLGRLGVRTPLRGAIRDLYLTRLRQAGLPE